MNDIDVKKAIMEKAPIKVLDHGYVRFIDSMGGDEDIVAAARMSTGRGFVSWDKYQRCKKCDVVESDYCDSRSVLPTCGSGNHDWQNFPRGDLGLLTTMYRDGHSTPFEFCELHVEVQAPIMVFREWMRHRTQAYSEFSARYSQMPNLHYVPERERVQKQSTLRRQGSSDEVVVNADQIIEKWREEQETVFEHYDALCQVGAAKEVARLNTPVSRYSKMRAKTDLRNWLGFLQLRLASSAQWEIRQFAQAVAEIVKALWPRTWALFEEYTLYGTRLSRTETAKVLEWMQGTSAAWEADPIFKKLRGE